MKAVGYTQSLDIDHPDALKDIEIPRPQAHARDLLVAVSAVSVNPVDTKVRRRASPESGEYKILGWDAVGEIVEVGDEASLSALATGYGMPVTLHVLEPTPSFTWWMKESSARLQDLSALRKPLQSR